MEQGLYMLKLSTHKYRYNIGTNMTNKGNVCFDEYYAHNTTRAFLWGMEYYFAYTYENTTCWRTEVNNIF